MNNNERKVAVAEKEKKLKKEVQNFQIEKKKENVVDILVEKANMAADRFRSYSQKEVDKIIEEMALTAVDNHIELAKMAYEETERGVYEDKITKNLFAAENVYNEIKNIKTAGVIDEHPEEDYIEIAEPAGVIAALIPVTNPTSTTIFKALISLKARNPVIFSFHPGALNCSIETAKRLKKAAVDAGAPENCINWIEKPSLDKTKKLIQHENVHLILATGGESMVDAAYSSGNPALGVGPGNVPCYIEKTANIKQAISDIVLSKTFDNGMICASEQGIIVDEEIVEEVKQELREYNCYFLNSEEIDKLSRLAVDEGSINPDIVGKPAPEIAEMAGFKVPETTKILVAELKGVGSDYPLSREKLSPILAFYQVDTHHRGINTCQKMIELGGMGHTAVIHSHDQRVIDEFSEKIQTGRILINEPSSQGAIGDLYNNIKPSLTLGCGTMGGNSTTDNVNTVNLINIKKITERKDRTRWFRIPSEIYFEKGSLEKISKLEGEKALIITDQTMVNLGYVDKVNYHLNKAGISSSVFSEVEPDPSVETVKKGSKKLREEEPDLIIALGGGSAIDAAKGMWLFYEKPDVEFKNLRLKFADIRKKTFDFPKLGSKAKMVAIPTTSGTGSEVTAFTVITDKKKNVKYPITDYALTPNIAIIDPDLVMTVPPGVTADTGLDVLTHAIEAYVSVMASDYTDALAEKAVKMVFEYLPRAYHNGEDEKARKKMHDASCLAGMAFTNAFLGLNHSMAHILGGKFHIPHGRANAILLPYIIEYNAGVPSKLTAYPQYKTPVADKKYARLAEILELTVTDIETGVKSLIENIRNLMFELDIPQTISENGVTRDEFERQLDDMADIAFNDQCTGTNPRMPLINEIKAIYRKAF
ncbi:MAG: bifunctional acetaldehyde-CoA/alcohol dehydrogenase [Bacillota bacterium]